MLLNDRKRGSALSDEPPPQQRRLQRDLQELNDFLEAGGMGVYQWQAVAAAGMISLANGLAITCVTYLSPLMSCEWELDEFHEAAISAALFAGMLIGSPVSGLLADRWGRASVIKLAYTWALIAGCTVALSVGFYTIVLTRFLLGIGVGAIPVPFVLLSEVLPVSSRAGSLLLSGLPFTIGNALVIMFARLLIPHYEWYVFALCSGLVFVFVILCFPWIRESPRWLLLQGKRDQCQRELLVIGDLNDIDHTPSVELTAAESIELDNPVNIELMRGSVADTQTDNSGGVIGKLFSQALRRTTLILFWLGFCTSLMYYGGMFLVTEIREHRNEQSGSNDSWRLRQDAYIATHGSSSGFDCQGIFTNTEHLELLYGAGIELCILIALWVFIDRCPRITVVSTAALVTGVSFLMVLVDNLSFQYVMLESVRLFSVILFQMLFVYVPEVLPTTVRGTGFGLVSACARVAGISSGFIAQGLSRDHEGTALLLLGFAGLTSGTLACALPMETKTAFLRDHVEVIDVDPDSQKEGKINSTENIANYDHNNMME